MMRLVVGFGFSYVLTSRVRVRVSRVRERVWTCFCVSQIESNPFYPASVRNCLSCLVVVLSCGCLVLWLCCVVLRLSCLVVVLSCGCLAVVLSCLVLSLSSLSYRFVLSCLSP